MFWCLCADHLRACIATGVTLLVVLLGIVISAAGRD